MRFGKLFPNILFVVFFLYLFTGTLLYGEITQNIYAGDKTLQCPQWDVLDIEFIVREIPADPFETAFSAVFRGPQNSVLKIPGFFNGDKYFLLRFSPPQPGLWTFETSSSLPALAGKRGSVECTPQTNPDRHGPVIINKDNPQHFYYRDGTPYFLLAFEADWLFALDLGNKTGIPKTITLVDQVADAGFNQVILNVYAHDVSWEKDKSLKPEFDFGSPKTFPFGGSNDQPDFTTLNTDFFKHFDRIIGYLDKKGIIAHLMIYVWNKNVNWPDMYSVADNRYFDYVIKRYQAFNNIIWDISKEALTYGRCDMNYINERIQRVRQLDAFRRLLTVHDYDYCSKFPENVDFISIQYWHTDLYNKMLSIRELYNSKPVYNIEHGGYERGPYVVFNGDYTDPVACLERNYLCVFAGTYSTYYWQCTSWYMVIPDPMGLPEPDRPEFRYYRHLVDLFNKYDFNRLKPCAGYSSSGYCLSTSRDLFLYLVPNDNFATHIILPEEAVSLFNVIWFNPLTGEFMEKGRTGITGWQEFKSPWPAQTAILILDGIN
ncbi:DUF4038 domain-containing protein [candidate division KSB1 bacterium]|nr:DUF4038 domain-containing protein [candidate division KSB1 bacterium]